jgi:hypothetical protein
MKEDTIMQEYRIWVDIRGGYYTTIEAESLSDALDFALDRADATNCDEWDYDVMEG